MKTPGGSLNLLRDDAGDTKKNDGSRAACLTPFCARQNQNIKMQVKMPTDFPNGDLSYQTILLVLQAFGRAYGTGQLVPIYYDFGVAFTFSLYTSASGL